MTTIQATSPSRFTAIVRILIALPLIGIGMMHLTGASPMLPILEGAGIPFAEFNAVFIPVLQVLSGLFLVSGFYARIGAVVSAAIMAGALFIHAVHDWAEEPTGALAVAILLGSTWILKKGAGGLSLDRKECTRGIV